MTYYSYNDNNAYNMIDNYNVTNTIKNINGSFNHKIYLEI